MKKLLTAILSGALLIGVLTGCSMAYGDKSSVTPLVSEDVADSEKVLETLRWADTVKLNKNPFSINDVYSVEADGVKLGEIRGQYIYALGDTYSFFSEAGNLVASEGEALRVVTHKADLFDYNNKPVGSIQESISWPFTSWGIYDEENTKVGEAKQNLSLTLNFTVNDSQGNPQYEISKSMFSVGAEITITRVANEASVAAMDAVWLAAITNEIDEANQNDDK